MSGGWNTIESGESEPGEGSADVVEDGITDLLV